MSVSIFPLGLRGNSVRRRPSRCPVGVESMEGRALLASAAVTGAIYQVQQEQLDLHRQIDQEVTFLRSNNLTIQDATKTFIYNAKSNIVTLKQDALANPANAAADKAAIVADQKLITNASRDEKFATGQQNQSIRDLNNLGKQVDKTVKGQTNDLNHGKTDPANIQTSITAYSNTVQTSITDIDTKATKNLTGLTSTFDAGKA